MFHAFINGENGGISTCMAEDEKSIAYTRCKYLMLKKIQSSDPQIVSI